jgi:hypothetical protein
MVVGANRRSYAGGVLAEGRHVRTSSRIKPAALVLAGVVAAVAVILVFLLKGGGANQSPFSPDPQTPDFAFEASKVLVVPTTTQAETEKLKTKAKVPSDDVKKIMNALYVNAFLDPTNWKDGSYDDVWTLFDTGSGTEAQAQVDTLTAGTGAGAAFDTILPTGTSTLKMKVLFDPKEEPYSVVAIAKFKATGSGKDGQDLQMLSNGQFVFQKVDGTWKVVSFKVLRKDQQQAAPSPSASGSST